MSKTRLSPKKMDTDTKLSKVGNGYHANLVSKNRLRIQGTAILERENQPNITATYDYNTSCTNEFFEEDVNQLHCFELNKIALGMTIFKKDESSMRSKALENGTNNGTALIPHKFEGNRSEPYLTDVIWSRMDITNPSANPNAYIIKQYYPKVQRNYTSHADKCNTFLCGFISCCIMLLLACVIAYFYNQMYRVQD